MSKWATNVADNLLTVGTSIATVFFQVLTVLLLTYYLSADGPRLRRSVCSLLPAARQHEVLRAWDLATQKTGAYISSRFLLAGLSGVFHWLAFSLIGLPSAVALALWVGVISQFIPAIGTYLAGILPALVAVGIDPIKALWVIGAVLIYQQIENYVLQPRITAQTLDLHPGVSIVAVLAGTALLGGVGAVLALPVIATLTGFTSAYVQRHELVEAAHRPNRPTRTNAPGRRASDRSTNKEVEAADEMRGRLARRRPTSLLVGCSTPV
ncbi:MAG: AI-2E family transporter [Acidimicrobiales bacterium]